MIRDTFETNPGLCELFKRKIAEKARFVGLSENEIDFDSQIDMKGTYQDNLRSIYREYPQLSQDSDYYRIKAIRSLSGAALEQSWRAYERNNGREIPGPSEQRNQPPRPSEPLPPELFITYTIGAGPEIGGREDPREPEPVSPEPIIQPPEASFVGSTHSELVKSILDRVTATAGERVTRMILHQIGQEIGRSAYHHSEDHTLFQKPIEALDHVLSARGLGRVVSLDTIDQGTNVTYVCTTTGCHNGVSPTPTCAVVRGVVSRWLESFVQKKAQSIRTASAPGSEPCVVHVTFRK
jgi:hypothetical protein